MVKRLKSLLKILFVAVCYGTLLAQVIILAMFWVKWDMNGDRLQQALLIARGGTLESDADEGEATVTQQIVSYEEPSFDEVLQKRAFRMRDLELQEQAVQQDSFQLGYEKKKLEDEKKRLVLVRSEFEKQLKDLEARQQSAGLEENVVMLQNLDPVLAKFQLLKMYESDQMEAIIDILTQMDPGKRRRITGEFQVPEEKKILAEILKRIRDGRPVTELTETAQNGLNLPSGNEGINPPPELPLTQNAP